MRVFRLFCVFFFNVCCCCFCFSFTGKFFFRCLVQIELRCCCREEREKKEIHIKKQIETKRQSRGAYAQHKIISLVFSSILNHFQFVVFSRNLHNVDKKAKVIFACWINNRMLLMLLLQLLFAWWRVVIIGDEKRYFSLDVRSNCSIRSSRRKHVLFMFFLSLHTFHERFFFLLLRFSLLFRIHFISTAIFKLTLRYSTEFCCLNPAAVAEYLKVDLKLQFICHSIESRFISSTKQIKTFVESSTEHYLLTHNVFKWQYNVYIIIRLNYSVYRVSSMSVWQWVKNELRWVAEKRFRIINSYNSWTFTKKKLINVFNDFINFPDQGNTLYMQCIYLFSQVIYKICENVMDFNSNWLYIYWCLRTWMDWIYSI